MNAAAVSRAPTFFIVRVGVTNLKTPWKIITGNDPLNNSPNQHPGSYQPHWTRGTVSPSNSNPVCSVILVARPSVLHDYPLASDTLCCSSWEKNPDYISTHRDNVAHVQDDQDTFFGGTQTNGWSSEGNPIECLSSIINQVTFGMKEIQCVDCFIKCTPVTTRWHHQTQGYEDENR